MSIRETIAVVVRLKREGLIRNYAIAGAVAALNYIEPFLTQDLDILVSVGDLDRRQSGLVLLTPIDTALAKMGYRERSDVGIMIEGWPVQFLPVASPLDQEALDEAIEIDISIAREKPLTARCLRAQHVVATAVKVGRPKDWARVAAFLEQGAVDLPLLRRVLDRHTLLNVWRAFCMRAGIQDPLG
jgi:hypothetical protein